METKNIKLENSLRCSANELELILKKLPIEIEYPNIALYAKMGLSKII